MAEKIWKIINPNEPFQYITEQGFEYDVEKRIPDTSKAKNILNFEAKISLDDSINEVIKYMKR